MSAPTQRASTPNLTALYMRVVDANEKADAAIAAYEKADAALRRAAGGDLAVYHVDKRDSTELAGLGSRAAFRVANAARLGSLLNVELLGSLVRQGEAREARQRL